MALPTVLARRRIRLMVRLVANGLAQAGVAIATARLFQITFDRIIGSTDPQAAQLLLWITAGLIAAAVLLAWLRKTEYSDAERMGQDYVDEVRMCLYDSLRHCALRRVQGRTKGSIMLRFVGDLNAVKRWVSLGIARFSVAVVTVVGATVALALLNWKLALVAGATLALGTIGLLWLGAHLRAAVRESRRRRSRLAGNLNEKIASLAVVQVFGRSDRERRRVARQSRRLKQAMIRQANAVGRLRGIGEASTTIAAGAVLVVGAFEVVAGQATAGTVVAAMGIVGMLTTPLRQLARVYEYWQGASVAREKLVDFLDNMSFVKDVPGAPALEVNEARLAFQDVAIAGSLHNFTAEVQPGQVVALVGPNGAGKSSVLQAAARLLDPERGAVLVDGQDIAQCSLNSVRRAISMLSPDLPLMRGTVERNVRYRCPDASDEELLRVIALCGMSEVLEDLPKGIASRIREGGVNLSFGQRQRIALARAVFGHPAILLLDEAEDNLDPRAAKVLDRVIQQFAGTMLMVTHRWERAAKADVIWYVDNGRLVEQGSPRKLFSEDGPTSRLFRKPYGVAV